MERAKGAWFAFASIGFVITLFLLAGVAYIAPVEMALEHAPKIAYAVFAFAFGMLLGTFVGKDGIRRPTGREVARKLPLVIGSLTLCIIVLCWLDELRSFTAARDDLSKACQTLKANAPLDTDEPTSTEAMMQAEQNAIIAAQRITKVWSVRHAEVSENAPCDSGYYLHR